MVEVTTNAGAPRAPVQHRSPFVGHAPGERPTRSGQIGVRLSAGTISSVTQVATWHNGIDVLAAALGTAMKCAVPARTGDTVHLDAALLVRSGPEEFMLISQQSVDMAGRLREHIEADIGSVTDLSHARCHIRIEGDQCCNTLSKLFALDFREPQFPLDQVRLTGHHHVACMLHRRELDCFDIYVLSTYAFDQLSTLLDAALEYGVSLAVFPSGRSGLYSF